MSATAVAGGGNGDRVPVTVMLPTDLVDRLMQFCRDHRLLPDEVAERALEEYFREGDMSH